MDTFKKALAACAAAGCFSLGAYVGLSGVDAISSAKIKAEMATERINSAVDAALLKNTVPQADAN